MTEAGQTGLTEFGDDSAETDDRPDEEAVAVAGNGGSDAAEVIDVVEETLPESEGDLELAVMQVDYTIAGYGDEERPIMHVFGRTPDGELEHVQVVGFKPYFYAPTETLERPPEEQYDRLTGSREYDEDGEPYESIRGEKLTKIFGQTPRDVGQVRDDFNHYEADILFPNRFLIDKDVRSGIRVPERRADDGSLVVPHDEVDAADVDAAPRVNTFDIEVDDRSGFPEDGEEPILCLTSHDSYRDEYVMWLYEAPMGDGEIPTEITEYEPIEARSTTTYGASRRKRPCSRPSSSTSRTPTPMSSRAGTSRISTRRTSSTGSRNSPVPTTSTTSRSIVSRESTRSGAATGAARTSRVGSSSTSSMATSGWSSPNWIPTGSTPSGRRSWASERSATPATSATSGRTTPRSCSSTTCGTSNSASNSTASRRSSVLGRSALVRRLQTRGRADAGRRGRHVRPPRGLRAVRAAIEGPTGGRRGVRGGAVFEPITGVKENVTVLDLKCFSGDTEVMTPDGPTNIKDLDVGDEMYTLDPDTFECEITPVSETHEYENQYGQLHHLGGNTHDLKVTENHQFLVSNTRGWDDLARTISNSPNTETSLRPIGSRSRITNR